MKFHLSALLIAMPFVLFSQKSPVKFGSISNEEMLMTTYHGDSAATAVVLFDVGEFMISTEYYFKRHVRIKILKKDGFRWADVSIPKFEGQEITGLKASTFNLVDGKIEESKVEGDGKFKEVLVEGLDLMKFTFPNVKEGSILEYSYKVNQGPLMDWEFQSLIPTAYSEYKVTVHTGYQFNSFMQGYLSAKFYDEKIEYIGGRACKVKHWIFEEIPALKTEPFMSSYKNYLAKVKFNLSGVNYSSYSYWTGRIDWGYIDLMGSWEKMRKSYLSNQFDQNFFKVKESGFLKKHAEEAIKNCKSPEEKIIAISDFVKKSIEWNNINGVSSTSLKKAFDKKTGHSGEINLIMLAMLHHAGIVANPVLISTKGNGFVREDVINPNQFNRVIVSAELANGSILLDATDKYLPYNFLPELCYDGLSRGFKITESSHQWVTLESRLKSKLTAIAKLKISPEGDVDAEIAMKKNGHLASPIRSHFQKKEIDNYKKTLFTHGDVEFTESKFEHADTLIEQTNEIHTIKLNNYLTIANSRIYFNPIIHGKISENPFKKEVREYPVDFGFAKETIYSASINIPNGYEVDELPKPKLLMLPNGAGKFMINCSVQSDEIKFMMQFVLNKSIFLPEEYATLREFYTQVVAKQEEQVVLKKKA